MTRLLRVGVAITVSMVSIGCFGVDAFAQAYPSRPLRLIVPTAPGASVDKISRLVGGHLTQSLGQQVVVDNRSGASQVIGTQIVARSEPDGYTLLTTSTPFVTQPLLKSIPPFSPVKDFSPITLAAYSPNILVVNQSLPVRSVAELIALAKSQPGKLNYGTGSSGASPHLAAELFKSMAKVDFVQVSYRGAAPALIDLIAGRTQLMFATAVSVMPHVKNGRLRALAVTSLQPSPALPGLPTVAASGLPGYESGVSYGFVAPAKTPPRIIGKLHAAIVKILNREDVKRILLSDSAEIVASSPADFAAYIKSEIGKWQKLFKEINLRID